MSELVIRLNIPDSLACELETAASESRMPVEQYAAETLECCLASRRLPSVAQPQHPKGARVKGTELESQEEPKAEYVDDYVDTYEDEAPVELPDNFVDSVSDIT